MENHYEGDLSDIVRAATTTSSSPSSSSSSCDHNPNYPIIMNFSAVMEEEAIIRRSNSNLFFGDPLFSDIMQQDPFHQLLNYNDFSCFNNYGTNNNSAEMIFTTTTTTTTTTSSSSEGVEETSGVLFGLVGGGGYGGGDASVLAHKIDLRDHMMMRMPNCDHKVFSNLVQNQISHNASLDDSPAAATLMQAVKPPPDASEDSGGRQILASWNPGLKRSERKKEVKKVVCIPAPAAANSRTSGEVVPSDLWAWRKYGQKPIKGSPYPRGYYRCSSSKGCSARKQVERSRTDPNMLVITYNSEHNHPWPTQRNALAGSVRSHHHHSKTNNDSDQTMASKVIMDLKQQKSNVVAENCAAERSSSSNSGSACASSSSLKPKQEMMMMDQKSNEMDGGDQLFAELGELFMEAHDDDDDDDDDDHDQYHYPLNLLVSQGFDDYAAHHHHDHHTQCRGLNDPFHDDLFNSLS